MVTLDETKQYLRVDFDDDDEIISGMINTAKQLCRDVARFSDKQWEDIDSTKPWSDLYKKAELSDIRATLKTAILYTVAYLYEHREDADHHDLALTLRSLLFTVHEGGF